LQDSAIWSRSFICRSSLELSVGCFIFKWSRMLAGIALRPLEDSGFPPVLQVKHSKPQKGSARMSTTAEAIVL
jgi:hypothetical protein